MKKQGFTQETLAKALNISASAVSRWLSGSLPRPARLKHLAEILGVTVRYLEFGLDPQAETTLEVALKKAREKLVEEDDLTERTLAASTGRRQDIEKLVHERLEELCMQEFPDTPLLIEDCTEALKRFNLWVQAYREKMLASKTKGEKIEP